jgi:hypothetical protein
MPLRWDLAPPRRPMSRRLFGENKAWRGALFIIGGTVSAVLALHSAELPGAATCAGRRGQPGARRRALGIASWTGELPNSFVKRRLGTVPGEQRRSPLGVAISVVDQADWVPAAWLLSRPVWTMTPRETAQAFVTVRLGRPAQRERHSVDTGDRGRRRGWRDSGGGRRRRWAAEGSGGGGAVGRATARRAARLRPTRRACRWSPSLRS